MDFALEMDAGDAESNCRTQNQRTCKEDRGWGIKRAGGLQGERLNLVVRFGRTNIPTVTVNSEFKNVFLDQNLAFICP